MNSLRTLLLRWSLEDVGPRPPESRASVEKTFAAVGYRATSDVVHLYGEIGGMDIGDNHLWRLWPLPEVAAQEPTDSGVQFADYMLSSWLYRLRPISAEESAVYVDFVDGTAPALVAASLEDFFSRYVKNTDLLLDPGSHPD